MPRVILKKYKCLTCGKSFRNLKKRSLHKAYHRQNHVLEEILATSSQQSSSAAVPEEPQSSSTVSEDNVSVDLNSIDFGGNWDDDDMEIDNECKLYCYIYGYTTKKKLTFFPLFII